MYILVLSPVELMSLQWHIVFRILTLLDEDIYRFHFGILYLDLMASNLMSNTRILDIF